MDPNWTQDLKYSPSRGENTHVQFLEFLPKFLFKELGSNQGPITLPKCYFRLQNGLSVPSVFS
jgi:hypothetical protein